MFVISDIYKIYIFCVSPSFFVINDNLMNVHYGIVQ